MQATGASGTKMPGGASLLFSAAAAIAAIALLVYVFSHGEYRQQLNPARYPPRLIGLWSLAVALAIGAMVCGFVATWRAAGRRFAAASSALSSALIAVVGVLYPLVALVIQILREMATMKGPGWH